MNLSYTYGQNYCLNVSYQFEVLVLFSQLSSGADKVVSWNTQLYNLSKDYVSLRTSLYLGHTWLLGFC